ncbi:MAG: hypothetical protein IKC26_04660 [Clostridia bacterium]|nr:hypothetical protein [Clostridia bacterium]
MKKRFFVILTCFILVLTLPITAFAALEPLDYWYEVHQNTLIYDFDDMSGLQTVTESYEDGYLNFYDFSSMDSMEFENYLEYSYNFLEPVNKYINGVNYQLNLSYLYWFPFGDVELLSSGYLTISFFMCLTDTVVFDDFYYTVADGYEFLSTAGTNLQYDVLGYSDVDGVESVTTDVYSVTSPSDLYSDFFVEKFDFPTRYVRRIDIKVRLDALTQYTAFGLRISGKDWMNESSNINPYVAIGICSPDNNVSVYDPVTNEDLKAEIQEVKQQLTDLNNGLLVPDESNSNVVESMDNVKDDLKGDLESIGDALVVPEPDIDSARDAFYTYFQFFDVDLAKSTLGVFFDRPIVTGMAAIVAFISLVSFLLFGKKG